MPQITFIKPQKNNKRVNVYVDDKFAFGLDLQTYLKEGLKVGQEISDDDIEKIVKRGNFQDSYDKILRFASLRPRSKKEFEIWLKKYEVHESLYDELFNKLEHLDLLDDKKFAVWWIGQRVQFRPKSKRILNQELRIKGIKQVVIDEALQEVEIDERSAARKVLAKKERLWKGLTGYDKRKKIYTYLAGHGYDGETIRDLIGELEDD